MSQPERTPNPQSSSWARLRGELITVCGTLPKLNGELWVILSEFRIVLVQVNSCYAFVANYSQRSQDAKPSCCDATWITRLDADWDVVAERVRTQLESPLGNWVGGYGHLRATICKGRLIHWTIEQLNREEGGSNSRPPRLWQVTEPAHYRYLNPPSPPGRPRPR